jgi:transcriptional regulator with XRE-family HTH domain
MTKKFRKLIQSAERSPIYWAEAAWLQFTGDLHALMESHGVTRAELARRVGVSPAYITKVFRGTINLTLESMCKLTLALDASPRIHVAPIDKLTRWNDVPRVNVVRSKRTHRSDSPPEPERELLPPRSDLAQRRIR